MVDPTVRWTVEDMEAGGGAQREVWIIRHTPETDKDDGGAWVCFPPADEGGIPTGVQWVDWYSLEGLES